MKNLLLASAFLLFATPAFADTYVHGYYRADGTYVAPHWRSDANGNPDDNYSSPGNYNPHNGKIGGKEPTYNPPEPFPMYTDSGTNPYPSSSGSSGSTIYVPKLNAPVGSLNNNSNCPPRTSIYQPRCD